MSTTTIRIEGMSCGHCVKAVTQALAHVTGIKTQAVSVGEAKVEAATGQALDQAVHAINEAGFEASIVAAPGR